MEGRCPLLTTSGHSEQIGWLCDGQPTIHVVGDLLVRVPSAYGRDAYGPELFSGADVLHVGRSDHFDLLNHPEVHEALERWLA